MPNPELHRQRDRAAQVQRRYNEQVAVIHGDQDLSREGRQRKLAAAYAKATRDLSALAEAERVQLVARREALERDVYSAPYGVRADAGYAISARDASDRAAQLKTPAEAAELLRRAEGDRDELLARAVARRAMDASYTAVGGEAVSAWEGVFWSFLDQRPNLRPLAEEIGEIEAMSEHQLFSPFSVARPHGVDTQHLNAAAHGVTEPDTNADAATAAHAVSAG